MIVRLFVVLLAVAGACSACTPPAPSPPFAPEAGDASPCAVDEAITAARLIRTADGSALVIHCPDGGQ
jgi:hypothetical protein